VVERSDPDRYIALVEDGRGTLAGEERLDADARRFESLSLALRTDAGVPAEHLPVTEDLVGLVETKGARSVLTLRGRLLAKRGQHPARHPPGPRPPPVEVMANR